MRKLFLMLAIVFGITFAAQAQIPYYAGAPKNNYFYTSGKIRVESNPAFETYTTYQRGIIKGLAVGIDYYTYNKEMYIGYQVRGTFFSSPKFSIGGQVTPSFDVCNKHKFAYLTTGLFLNGNIYEGLHWVDNVWITTMPDGTTTVRNWAYLANTFTFNENNSLTPMVGFFHDMYGGRINPDLGFGAYWTCGSFGDIYLWTDKTFEKNPRIILGIDFFF